MPRGRDAEVPGELIQAVHHNSFHVAGEPQQFREIRPTSVPARDFIREDPAENLALELALLVLVESAHAHVPESDLSQ